MRRLTGDPFDRDSDTYRELVAPGIYDSLIRTGLTVAARHPVVLDAPFLSTVRAAGAAGLPLGVVMRQHAEAEADLPVVTVWIDSPTEQIMSGTPGHGSVPVRDGAMNKRAHVLTRLSQRRLPVPATISIALDGRVLPDAPR
jgi:hypothetical protein